MKQRALPFFLCICMLIAYFMPLAAFAEEMQVPVSRSQLISLSKEAEEVVIADPNIADVYVHDKNRISVIGKAIGKTSLRAFDFNGELLKDITVAVTFDLPEIRKALKNFFPYEKIGVEMVNDNIAITGTISDAETAESAVKIVEEFVNEGRINPQTPANIINLAKIRTGQQVMLRVRVGEIQRTALKNLGVDLSMLRNAGKFSFVFGSNAGIEEVFGSVGASFTTVNNSLSAALQALEQDGIFKVLAEPNLVAVSGEKAEFLAGGEFPVPVAQNEDQVTIEFKEYGVSTHFTPFVLSQDRLRIIVQPEVSELTDAGSIRLNSITVPGLTARRVKTTVELAPGESFMIAGLISDRVNSTIREMPGIAETPILSALFRGTSYERQETELVIAVTPYLVDPVTNSDIRLPTDNYRHASMMESFFYGALSSNSFDEAKRAQTPSLEGPVGFMME